MGSNKSLWRKSFWCFEGFFFFFFLTICYPWHFLILRFSALAHSVLSVDRSTLPVPWLLFCLTFTCCICWIYLVNSVVPHLHPSEWISWQIASPEQWMQRNRKISAEPNLLRDALLVIRRSNYSGSPSKCPSLPPTWHKSRTCSWPRQWSGVIYFKLLGPHNIFSYEVRNTHWCGV